MAAKMEVPFFRAELGQAEKDEVLKVIDSGWLTSGRACQELERAAAAYLGRAHGVAVNNGTAALHLALLTSGVQPGQGVLVPTHTFAATAEAVIYIGAVPILCEVDPVTLNLDLDYAARLLADPSNHPLARRGQKLPLIAAILPVHYAGLMVDMERVAALAAEHNLQVVEDAAHTFGAYRLGAGGRRIGVGDLSGAAALSFYATKNVTTGEGGMVLTDDAKRAERLLVLRLHGLDKSAYRRFERGASWRVDILELGYKYNLADINAALALPQVARADALWQRRREAAAAYSGQLAGIPGLGLPNDALATAAAGGPGQMAGHSWCLYPVRLGPLAKVGRDQCLTELAQRGVASLVHWQPLHLHPFYAARGYRPGDFPAAEQAFAGLMSLPFFAGLRPAEIEYVAACMREVLAP
ncbi:MAG: DegT/DnrJ/EryC1/StrS family aminotransferase [Desulfarculus sp.]|nr:MAG: DegT/DnrJ/EryC1/StrS family aminotransferase [Desulfarculus sp.]